MEKTNTLNNNAESFYADALSTLSKCGFPFMIGGTYAVRFHTGIDRETKDLDIFCKAGDYPKLVECLSQAGYQTYILDDRWIAKAQKGKHFIDIIFGSGIAIYSINDNTFKNAPYTELFGVRVKVLPVEELIWAKIFVQDRNKYEGADIAHLILKKGKHLNWRLLLSHMEQYWEVLFMQIINFRFIYPSERDIVPKWLIEELISRLQSQLNNPTPQRKITRGRLFSRSAYEIDVNRWGFKDVIS